MADNINLQYKAFAFLAPGLAVGVWAMSALRRSPGAPRLAGGRR